MRKTGRKRDDVTNTGRWNLPIRLALAAFVLLSPAPGSGVVPTRRIPPERTRADVRHARLGWIAVALIGIGGSALAAHELGIGISTRDLDGSHHLVLRMLLGTLLLMMLARAAAAWRSHAARYWTTWWDPALARTDGDIGWSDVLELTVGGDRGDALTRRRVFRRRYFWSHAHLNALGIAAASIAAAIAADGLLRWRLPDLVWAGREDPGALVAAVTNASANLTAYLALLAAAVSIVFTYRQLRAKVRADNRQVWIDRARGLLAEIIAGADAGDPIRDTISKRLELELMLNPREKDHRLLIFLVQRLARVRNQEAIGSGLLLRKAIASDLAGSTTEARRPALLDVLDERDRGVLVSYVVRLSHIMLKREWERVKHTR